MWKIRLGRRKELAEELNVIQNSDDDFIIDLAQQVLADFPDKVDAYKNGKKGLLGLFMGEVMKRSGGKADPQMATKVLRGSFGRITHN